MAASPALFYALRLTAAVCLALWVTFSLELDAPYWAATSAGITCQATLGASRRKGAYRLVGTCIGLVFVVALEAAFPQSRYGFLIGMAAWAGLCCFASSLLSTFPAYAAALAGYTAAIIAGDAATAPDQTFVLAISRASEIAIGIVCATVVVAGTDLGRARRDLLERMSAVTAELAGRLTAALRTAGQQAVDGRPADDRPADDRPADDRPADGRPADDRPADDRPADDRPARRALLRRISELGKDIDLALGEASDLQERRHVLTAAVNGMFSVASEWRTITGHLRTLRDDAARHQAAGLLADIPSPLAALLSGGDARSWAAGPAAARDRCAAAGQALAAASAGDPSSRLLADRLAVGLLGLSDAANGVALLGSPTLARRMPRQPAFLGAQDLLPPVVNGVRAFLTLIAVQTFWVATDWQGGQGAVTFAFVTVVLLGPRGEAARSASAGFAAGTFLAAAFAAVAEFALLPQQQSFAGLALVMALFLIPLGVLSTVPRFAPVLVATVMNFTPLLGPTNQITYDPGTFYNSALAIVAGVVAAVVAFHLIPSVPGATRSARLLGMTLAELRRLATQRRPMSRRIWEARIYRRLSDMPEQATPLELARLVTAMAVGSEIIVLRHVAGQSVSGPRLGACLRDVANGRIAAAIAGLGRLDAELTAASDDSRGSLRVRAAVLALAEALQAHASYFVAGARAP